MIADADGQRAARTALTDHRSDNRDFERRHDLQITGDGFALTAFLGVDPRVSSGRIDEGQHRQPESLGHAHQAPRLAVAFGPRHAEFPPHFFAGVAAFLMTDDHHRLAFETAYSADDCGIVGERAIAV